MQLIELGDLLDIVRSSSLVCPDAILDAIKVKNQCRSMDLNYRGMLCKYGREGKEGGGWGTSVAVWT